MTHVLQVLFLSVFIFQPEGNYYFKTSDSYQILKSCSINISDCLKSPGTCDFSPCITSRCLAIQFMPVGCGLLAVKDFKIIWL
jgi:hypothetical protein